MIQDKANVAPKVKHIDDTDYFKVLSYYFITSYVIFNYQDMVVLQLGMAINDRVIMRLVTTLRARSVVNDTLTTTSKS